MKTGTLFSRALSACIGLPELEDAARVAFVAMLERHRSLRLTAQELAVSTRHVRRLLDAYDLELAKPKPKPEPKPKPKPREKLDARIPRGYAQHPERSECSCTWCVWRREMRREVA